MDILAKPWMDMLAILDDSWQKLLTLLTIHHYNPNISKHPRTPNCPNCSYWKWPLIDIHSGFTNEKWWFSHQASFKAFRKRHRTPCQKSISWTFLSNTEKYEDIWVEVSRICDFFMDSKGSLMDLLMVFHWFQLIFSGFE